MGTESPQASEVLGHLTALLASGRFGAGERLPDERRLAAQLGVSRTTLRVALGQMAERGLVERVPGRSGGTFVRGPKFVRDGGQIAGVPAMLRRQGFTAGTRILRAAIEAAAPSVGEALQIARGGAVASLLRVRLADSVPISLEEAWLPLSRFPDLLQRALGGSLYEVLEQHYGVRLGRTSEWIELVQASPETADLLEIPHGAPVLSISRRTVDVDGVPVECSNDLFRADRTVITVEGHGGSGVLVGDGPAGRPGTARFAP